MTTHADDIHFLRLALTHGVGSRTLHKLLSELGDVAAIFAASRATLKPIVPDTVAAALAAPPTAETQAKIDESLAWLAAAPEHHLLTWAHPAYPKALLESGDAPIVLYAKGRIELLANPAIAMVGSRNCSQGGADTAEAFAQAFAEQGVTVVSGMALGIDAASHVGALRAGNANSGSTIAVIGTGIDRVYPAKNKVLAHSIAERGLIVGEYPLGTAPHPHNFPRRNRIISGLSLGVLVVEATIKSGSLITARLASEQGKDVFAIPGSIHSPQSRGCHYLIKQGAKLVETAQDVMEELKIPLSSVVQAVAHDEEAPERDSSLLSALGFDIVSLDAIQARTGLPTPELQAKLLELELDGFVTRLPGGLFQRMLAG